MEQPDFTNRFLQHGRNIDGINLGFWTPPPPPPPLQRMMFILWKWSIIGDRPSTVQYFTRIMWHVHLFEHQKCYWCMERPFDSWGGRGEDYPGSKLLFWCGRNKLFHYIYQFKLRHNTNLFPQQLGCNVVVFLTKIENNLKSNFWPT